MWYPLFSPAEKKEFTLTHVGATADTSDLTAYTFSDHAIGDADSSRLVLVGILSNGGGALVSGVTVGGISGSLVVQNVADNSENVATIFQTAVPTGTTADIVVTHASSGQNGLVISVWSLVNANTTADDTADAGLGNPLSSNLDVPAGGGAVGVAMNQNAVSWSWVGLTDLGDHGPIDSGTMKVTSASKSFDDAQSALAITATANASTSRQTMVLASWGPL